MKKSLLLVVVLNALLLASAWAKDDGAVSGIGDSLKKAGDAVGSGMGKAGKAAAPEVGKAESWLGQTLKNGGKKLDKASK